jgi:hypothetical protein
VEPADAAFDGDGRELRPKGQVTVSPDEHGTVTANAPSLYAVSDLTMSGWEVELTHADGWDFVQVASVNNRSHLKIEADDGEGEVPFDGWRVTLNKAGVRALIERLGDLHSRLP